MIKFFLFLFAIMICSSMFVNSQTKFLQIKKTDNTSMSIDMSTLNKITFNDSNIILDLNDGTSSVLISTIRSIFVGVDTRVEEIQETGLCVYPNPVSDYIYLKNQEPDLLYVSVYSIAGQLLIQEQVLYSDVEINVRELPQGAYILKANDKTTKFTKK